MEKKEADFKEFTNDKLSILNNKEENKKNEITENEENIDNKENNEIHENNEKQENNKIEGDNKIEKNSNLIKNEKDKSDLRPPSEKSETTSKIIIQSVYIQDSSSDIHINKNETDSTILNESNFSLILKINDDYINKGKTLFKKSSSYKIIEIIKVLAGNKGSDFFKNTSKGIYISGGINKSLKIYDEYFEKKLEIKMKDWVYDTIERYSNEENEITLLSCCNNYIINTKINLENFEYRFFMLGMLDLTIHSFIKLEKENDYITFGGKGIFEFINFFEEKIGIKSTLKVCDGNYRGGIKINKVLYAFTSNSNVPNGEDKLIIYNTKSKAIVQTIEKYSFIVSLNGLCVIDSEISENNKILLCACKKYNSQQQNGILLINLEINDDDLKLENCFYDTNDFEVNCFCQICNVENNNIIGEDITKRENIKIYKTMFVLVGGFDRGKGGGMIKLYRLIKDDKSNCEKLEYLQDIEFEMDDNFSGFQNSISCMTQSNLTGNIIVTIWDENTYLLKPPNIDFYLK